VNNYLSPNDGPSRIEKFLEDMKKLFRELAIEQTHLKDEIVKLKADNADNEALRRVQDEMRVYTDQSVKGGVERGESRLEDKMANLRAGVLTEVDKTIKATLDEWTRDHITPLFEQLSDDREARKQNEREMQWQKVKNRITTATSLIALITAVVLFFLTFQGNGKPTDARHLDRLNSVGDAALSIQ